MEDAAWYLAREPLPLFGFTPDSDGYDIVNAEKGRMEFALSAPLPPASPLVELRGGLAGNMIPAEVTAVLDAARLTDAQRQALLRAAGPDTSVTDEAGRLTLTCRGGVRIEDLVLVTAGGAEVLNRLPKDLRVV